MSVVEFWNVGAVAPSNLAMGHGDISTHLAQDWVPSFPTRLSSQLVGWPRLLTELVPNGGVDFLALRSELGRSEKQWKGFVSWILGVAGTRHFLRNEGYRWVAPLSAFYPQAVQPVDLTRWHALYPNGLLTAQKPANTTTPYMPDYVAIRRRHRGVEWALAESKGTNTSLAGMQTCPNNWREQANNAELTYNGTQVTVARNVVVATRCNPGAVQPFTRRLQVRAWNRQIDVVDLADTQAILEIMSAHLFGLASNLGLRVNAQALAVASHTRLKVKQNQPPNVTLEDFQRLNAEADGELRQHLGAEFRGNRKSSEGSRTLRTLMGDYTVSLQSATLTLLRTLRSVRDVDHLEPVVLELDDELSDWGSEISNRATDFADSGWDPIGLELKYEGNG